MFIDFKLEVRAYISWNYVSKRPFETQFNRYHLSDINIQFLHSYKT